MFRKGAFTGDNCKEYGLSLVSWGKPDGASLLPVCCVSHCFLMAGLFDGHLLFPSSSGSASFPLQPQISAPTPCFPSSQYGTEASIASLSESLSRLHEAPIPMNLNLFY